MSEKIPAITKETLMPISLVMALLGGSAGLTKALARIDHLEAKVQSIEQVNRELLEGVGRIDRRLFKIEVRNGFKNIEPPDDREEPKEW